MYKSIRESDFNIFKSDEPVDPNELRSIRGEQQQSKLRKDVAGAATTATRLPILIFPGLMSSALRVHKSSILPSKVGKQAWLNLKAMGIGSIYKGGPLQSNEEKRLKQIIITATADKTFATTTTTTTTGNNNKNNKVSGSDARGGGGGEEEVEIEGGDEASSLPSAATAPAAYDETLHEEYIKETEAKNRWLRHICLKSDMVSEQDGVELRPVPGLEGVDYLLESGSVARHVAWVFGPVLKVLKAAGYKEGVDLDAAPYDWRVPPSILEKRDGYFTKTIEQVEDLYKKNDNTPVVLMCHSMGSKAAHYFLNFALKARGQEWIDTHIHTYFPIGAPHLGAPQAMRGTIEGDTFGLDAFLSEEEGVLLARSTGSVNWLYPATLPQNVPPAVHVRREGVLRVKVRSMNVAELFRDRASMPELLRLTATFGTTTLYSKFYDPKAVFLNIPDTFCFAAPPHLPSDSEKWDKKLIISLEEPGFLLTKRQQVGPWSRHILYSPLRWTVQGVYLCFPCKAVETTVVTAGGIAMSAVDKAAELAGTASTVATSVSGGIDLDTALSQRNPCQVMDRMMHVTDLKRHKHTKRQTDITIRIEWEPPDYKGKDPEEVDCSPICEASCLSPILPMATNINNSPDVVEYESLSGREVLLRERFWQSLKTMRDYYDGDPLGPKTVCSVDPPPVKRVKAVYGINVPTEIASVYKRQNYVEHPNHVRSCYERDRDASLPPDFEHYQVEEGVVLETSDTPQVFVEEDDKGGTPTTKSRKVHRSGDGTVPYFSLQHPNAWKDAIEQVEIDELPGVNHREILADKRFHKILLDYVISK